ncbi:Carboxylesterase family-domain-containing protein [Lipomyces kononenkoae]|uniref:Carboxylesterase family-domain-containing protein n=1 Tax=Lipomyces kononenkoae TaxID=34357 RepID=A0ACC3T1Q3_LIPKO
MEHWSELISLTFHAFLGIPFAEPPEGMLRFRHPQPYGSNWNVRNATEYAYSCPGYAQFSQNRTMKEDCLTINVVRPDFVKEGDDVPVLVWIYGGGFNGGSSADPTYNMSYIVDFFGCNPYEIPETELSFLDCNSACETTVLKSSGATLIATAAHGRLLFMPERVSNECFVPRLPLGADDSDPPADLE